MTAHSYSDANGEDKAMFPAFRAFIGKVRAGWITAVVIVSFITNIATHLLVSGWIVAPAKSTEVAMITATVGRLETATMKLADTTAILAVNMGKLEATMAGLKDQLASMDRKLDVLIAKPASEKQHPRIVVQKKGLFGF